MFKKALYDIVVGQVDCVKKILIFTSARCLTWVTLQILNILYQLHDTFLKNVSLLKIYSGMGIVSLSGLEAWKAMPESHALQIEFQLI